MGFSCCIKHYVKELIAIVPLTDDQKKLIAVYTREVAEQINEQLTGLEPFQIMLITIFGVLFMQYGLNFMTWAKENCSIENIKSAGFRFASTYIPQVKNHIDMELEKLRVDSVKKYGGRRKGALKVLPKEGKKPDEVLKMIDTIARPSWKYF